MKHPHSEGQHMTTIIGATIVLYGRLLLVRKKGRNTWIFPGGKRRDGEDEIQCLNRELLEELSPNVRILTASLYKEFPTRLPYSGEDVVIKIYFVGIDGKPFPSHEIAAITLLDYLANCELTEPTKHIIRTLQHDGHLACIKTRCGTQGIRKRR